MSSDSTAPSGSTRSEVDASSAVAKENSVTEAVIVAATRTPIGRANKGSVGDVDDIVLAESLQGGGVIARNVAVRLGLAGVPGLADNRHCAAGLSAIQIAAG